MTQIAPQEIYNLILYEPDTGRLVWKDRPESLFKDARSAKSWNSKYAGKDAFTAMNGNGYKRGAVGGKLYYAHRVAWFLYHGSWPQYQIDHINGDRKDNRISNLRSVTNHENSKNKRFSDKNTSGFTGVTWFKRDQKWKAQIMHKGKNYHLGYFDCAKEARDARVLAEARFKFHQNHGVSS